MRSLADRLRGFLRSCGGPRFLDDVVVVLDHHRRTHVADLPVRCPVCADEVPGVTASLVGTRAGGVEAVVDDYALAVLDAHIIRNHPERTAR